MHGLELSSRPDNTATFYALTESGEAALKESSTVSRRRPARPRPHPRLHATPRGRRRPSTTSSSPRPTTRSCTRARRRSARRSASRTSSGRSSGAPSGATRRTRVRCVATGGPPVVGLSCSLTPAPGPSCSRRAARLCADSVGPQGVRVQRRLGVVPPAVRRGAGAEPARGSATAGLARADWLSSLRRTRSWPPRASRRAALPGRAALTSSSPRGRAAT